MRERYDKTYVAIPITESPLLVWINNINPHKHFFHMSLFHMGNISDAQLPKIKTVISSNYEGLKRAVLQPAKLEIIGEDEKFFVLRVEDLDELYKIREIFERDFPEYQQTNLPFLPHITIEKLGYQLLSKRQREKLMAGNDRIKNIEPLFPKSIGVYYRTEEGATALLFSQKI